MKYKKVRLKKDFAVVLGNRHSQAAEMVLRGSNAEGDAHNRHRGADQWLYVISGTGTATIKRRRYRLTRGVLLLIERGDEHEIRHTGRGALRTLNFYVPPAYAKAGEPLPRGRR
jgi:mannose-6-phosphate isomerase-like protein (cupin superfamily)